MDGLLNIYKERDFTSFDVVAKLRGILKQRKIGHTGTLDPQAEGVLPICLGNATKLCDLLTDHDKVYEAGMLLGVTYDTQDIFGNKLTENIVMSTKDEIASAIKSYIGGYDQIPPMYSAKKVNGQKLYDLAREGKVVERKSVHVDIPSIEILDIDIPHVRIRVHCGKGTYIRTLISDIGEKLGCGAAMESLLRVKVGDFSIENAIKLSEVERLVKEGVIGDYIQSTDVAFIGLGDLKLTSELDRFVENGNVLTSDDIKLIDEDLLMKLVNNERLKIYDSSGRFRAVYEYYFDKKVLKPYKMFL